MEDLVLISIIVPVYNTGRFLKRCLDSCLSQTYQYVEIVAIDDGSTDNSLEILLDYSRKDQRVRVISKSNEGLILTRKRGVIEALGRYIFFG